MVPSVTIIILIILSDNENPARQFSHQGGAT